MTTIHIGCKNNMISTKKDKTNLILADIKTSEKTYRSFDVEVPNEKKVKDERKEVIKKICPHCKDTVNIQIKWFTKKELIRVKIFALGITISLLPLIFCFGLTTVANSADIFPIIIFTIKTIGIILLTTAGLIYLLCREPKDKKIMCKPTFKTDNPNHFLQYSFE